MEIMVFVCLGVLLILALCIFNVINISRKAYLAVWTLVLPHSLLLIIYAFNNNEQVFINVVFAVLMVLLSMFAIIKFNIRPLSKKITNDRRLRTLSGGRVLLLTSVYVTIVQSVLFLFAFIKSDILPFDIHIIITDLIINAVFVAMIYVNGFFRIIFLSRRMNIIKKVIFTLFMWMPVVNFFFILSMKRAVSEEYAHELYKMNKDKWRVETQICSTKYPLLLLHGVGFRDLKYLNYWGRIPRELIRNGAKVYYGNQEAWGTIESNAEDVKKKIYEIKEATGAKKVNIIAHSKGGLDARYTISQLGMDKYVASLTTISTPHRGSFIVDTAEKLPDKLIAFIGKRVNRAFKLIGDKNPDFMRAHKQFLTESAERFNEKVKDSSKVYYQSYASIMSYPYSDYILFIPFIIGLFCRKKNDGLVAPESAKWGEFKGVLETPRSRGISHGDMVDLRRNDYRDFDVREFYVKLAEDLKKKGY